MDTPQPLALATSKFQWSPDGLRVKEFVAGEILSGRAATKGVELERARYLTDEERARHEAGKPAIAVGGTAKPTAPTPGTRVPDAGGKPATPAAPTPDAPKPNVVKVDPAKAETKPHANPAGKGAGKTGGKGHGK